MSAQKDAALRVGALVRAAIEGHNEPACFRLIESMPPMNAGGGVALVAFRGPDDDQLASLMAAAPELLEALAAAEKALNNIRCCCVHTAWDATGPAVIAARAAIAKATAA